MNKTKAVAVASERARMGLRAAYLDDQGRIRFPDDYDESCYCHLHDPSTISTGPLYGCDAQHCTYVRA